MKIFDPGQRARRLGTIVLLWLLPVLPAQGRGRSEAWANTQFSTAQRMRESLNGSPAKERSRHEYERVINAYRRVYYGAPASAKAGPSVVAVADLLLEMGRSFDDDKDLRSAIGQYKFLRREYPGSRDRFQALFNIAEIYQDDLKDPAQAKPLFEEFLRRYPRNHLADAARAALVQPLPSAGRKAKDADKANARPADKTNSQIDADGDQTGTSRMPQMEDADGAAKPALITGIRHWSSQNYTRVAIDLERDEPFESRRIENPGRIFFDLQNTNLASSLLGKALDVDDRRLKKIRVAQFQPGKSRIVLEVADRLDYDTFLLTNPPRLIIDIHDKGVRAEQILTQGVAEPAAGGNGKQPVKIASLRHPELVSAPSRSEGSPEGDAKLPVASVSKTRIPIAQTVSNGAKKTVVDAEDSDQDNTVTVAKVDPPDNKPPAKAGATLASPLSKGSARNKRKNAESFPDAREASPTANGDRSLIRALGLKIGKIVIDPGHGGHDTGTIGPNGLEEKDLVLDVAGRLGKLLQARLGADVVYTRKDDTFIPLETRTSIANQEQADLFVSIHANSSRDRDARGVETYYLNFTSSAEALDVAARENAASDKSIHELQDLVKKIALKEKIEESREFASNVQRALHSGLAAKSPGIRDRGVKKAPFIVLIGANMPSILAEVSFVSNPGDERRLRTADYRQRIAESLYRGISKYVSGLSGVRVASRIDKSEGQ